MITKFKYLAMLAVGALMVSCSEAFQEPLPEKTETNPEKEVVNDPSEENEVKYTPLSYTIVERGLIGSQRQLAWDMLRISLAENEGSDVLISPLCTEIALAMTANGMDAESKSKVLNLLKSSDINTLNELYKKTIDALPYCNPDGVITKMSFSNWQDSRLNFDPGFAKTLKDVFGVPTFAFDFGVTDMQSEVNKWSYESTGGLISNLLDKPLGDDVRMVLCNSLYMNSKWELPFDKSETKAEDFKDLNGNAVGKAMMMRHKETTLQNYDQYEKYKVAKLSFKGKEFKMCVYLPMDGCKTMDELIEAIMNEDEARLAEKYETYRTPEMIMPKFEFSGNYKMNEAIKTLGVDLHNCKYSGISDKIEKIDMEQASSIRVEEEGTLVASVNIQYGKLSWSGTDPEIGEPFIVNRPFIYTITGPDGIILYMGTMSNPGVK